MPDDIKLVCIGKMKFNERLSLRCTAKAERSLVDSQKYEFFGRMRFEDKGSLSLALYCDHGCDFYGYDFKLNKYILKVLEFECLEIHFYNPLLDFKRFMTEDGMITTKKIDIQSFNMDNVVDVLRKTKNGVESIEMKLYGKEFKESAFDEILAMSHMWIDTNAEIGFTFQFSVYKYGSFEEFTGHFARRIVSINEKRVRIRTKNPDRHILLERGLDKYFRIYIFPLFYRLMVISAEMEESEYDNNCREWIEKMDEDIYYTFDSEYSSDSSEA
ncbi:hypothetical protein B9Z55_012765 [Caenorhabditis nigoni]|uniref:F-box domain-containing protein n=1 Tax=Caenorhabditis nigoni TaxID=1611254 RepID=A0A2G5TYS7_9PELO|nr:hypothetical protein B9Z55_012765 [Caenorhabditis nigoni]